jgi:hypothetical protein
MEGQSMGTRKVLASLAAASMVIGSTAAAAAPAARIASPTKTSEALGHNGWAWFLGLLILVGLIGVIAAGNNEDTPHSP